MNKNENDDVKPIGSEVPTTPGSNGEQPGAEPVYNPNPLPERVPNTPNTQNEDSDSPFILPANTPHSPPPSHGVIPGAEDGAA